MTSREETAAHLKAAQEQAEGDVLRIAVEVRDVVATIERLRVKYHNLSEELDYQRTKAVALQRALDRLE